MTAEKGQTHREPEERVRPRQILDPEKRDPVEIEILGQHVEHGDEYGDLDQEAEQALQRVQRMDALFAVQGDGAAGALLTPMRRIDGVDAGL